MPVLQEQKLVIDQDKQCFALLDMIKRHLDQLFLQGFFGRLDFKQSPANPEEI